MQQDEFMIKRKFAMISVLPMSLSFSATYFLHGKEKEKKVRGKNVGFLSIT